MKAKLYVRTIETPEDIATGPDGEQGWIKVRTRLKKKYIAIMNKGLGYAAALQNVKLDTGDMSPEAWAAVDRMMTYTDKDQVKVYNHLVLDWNWVDDETGKPLPKPNKPEVFGELYEHQIDWLQKQYNQLQRYKSTEGNAPSGTD